ncbi:RSZ32-like protein [Mya arenaria]|uniref:RSZ32-like protein n=1 Tax=Mya arenaria TaxID=6604 RepID=A0ABY7E2N8_MYAAR|nr:RSZ32-like protein [Mya arenaria]
MSRRFSSEGCLFVGRLGKNCRVRDLEDVFEPYGRMSRCEIKYAYAFVDYEDRRDAEDAIRYENGRDVAGSAIIVEAWMNVTGVTDQATGPGTAQMTILMVFVDQTTEGPGQGHQEGEVIPAPGIGGQGVEAAAEGVVVTHLVGAAVLQDLSPAVDPGAGPGHQLVRMAKLVVPGADQRTRIWS